MLYIFLHYIYWWMYTFIFYLNIIEFILSWKSILIESCISLGFLPPNHHLIDFILENNVQVYPMYTISYACRWMSYSSLFAIYLRFDSRLSFCVAKWSLYKIVMLMRYSECGWEQISQDGMVRFSCPTASCCRLLFCKWYLFNSWDHLVQCTCV